MKGRRLKLQCTLDPQYREINTKVQDKSRCDIRRSMDLLAAIEVIQIGAHGVYDWRGGLTISLCCFPDLSGPLSFVAIGSGHGSPNVICSLTL